MKRNLARLTEALKGGREELARDLLKEARFLLGQHPALFDEAVRRKLAAASTLLRSSAWRQQAARQRHGRRP
ncbi:hypothetical protein AB0E62_30300 [Streptomyces sp. NPDC038707]|uniref:hypothetical protein n=1 Tax=unclassified Streptomyces TaxID=2593676 RepID=UPI0033D657A7